MSELRRRKPLSFISPQKQLCGKRKCDSFSPEPKKLRKRERELQLHSAMMDEPGADEDENAYEELETRR